MKTYKETKEIISKLNPNISMPDSWEWRIDLSGANLSEADLREAYLRFADLSKANLSGAVGIVVIQFEGFTMWIRADKTRIGCEEMVNEEWLKLDIDTAVKMGIKRDHFEVYRAFFSAAMLILKPMDREENER